MIAQKRIEILQGDKKGILMKKTIIFLVLMMAFTLSACGTSGQEATSPNNASQEVAESAEPSNAVPSTPTQEDSVIEMPAAYTRYEDQSAACWAEPVRSPRICRQAWTAGRFLPCRI